MKNQCEAVHAPNEYCSVQVRCEKDKGHEEPHQAIAATNAIVQWSSVSFPVNFLPQASHDYSDS